MLSASAILGAAGRYLRRNPEEISRVAINAMSLRFGLPIDAFRWLADQLMDPSKVEDFELGTVPPGLKLAATFDLDDSRLRGGAVIYIDRIRLSAEQMRIELRFEDVMLVPVGDQKTQLTALLRAKALDVTRPGDLVMNLPGMPDVIVEGRGNRIVLDLMKEPKLREDPRVRHVMGLLNALITLDGVSTDETHLDARLKPLPEGFMAAADAVGDHLVVPGLKTARDMLPEGVRGEIDGAFRKLVGLIAGEEPQPGYSQPDLR
jgi:hypothetical protein